MAPKTTAGRKKRMRKVDKIDQLISIAAQECADAGVKLIFKDQKTDRDKNVGFFSAVAKELVVMTQEEDWFEVLAHELCHLRQVRDGVFKSEHEYLMWSGWIDGTQKLNMAQLIHCARYVQECELDCEKRTLKLLRELKLLNKRQQIDYIQRSNCYVLMYEVARRHGAWSKPKTPASQNKRVYGLLPTTWIEDVAAVPDDFEAAVVDNCY